MYPSSFFRFRRLPLRSWLRCRALPAVLLTPFCLLPGARAQTAVPPGESLVAGDPLAAFAFRADPAAGVDGAGFQIVEATGPGFVRAWRIETRRDTTPASAVELHAQNARAVTEGEVGFIRFFARTVSTADETGAGRLFLAVRKDGAEPASSFEIGLSFGREWQEFTFPFKFHRDFPAHEAAFVFRFGFTRQTVEIGGVEILGYGKSRTVDSLPRTRFSYAGREPAAAWRKEALARIEQVRKGDFAVSVTDAAGRPVPAAVVRVEQRRSAFQWGSALQFARLVNETPDNLIYRAKVLELFNAASPENDLKWVTWVGDWGPQYSPQQALAGLRWLRERGYYTRGHVLVWPGWRNLPLFVQALKGTPREKEIPGVVEAHIRELTATTRGLLDEWDALNEPFTNHDLMDLFGPGIMADWFKVAHACLPGVPFYFNDFSNHDLTTDRKHVEHYEATTRFLLEQGAPVGGLGLQAHIGTKPNAPEEVLKVLDRYAKFNLPIRVTEFDINTDDEELQADYTRDFLTLMFSHPSVVGVQHWGFWENAHWRPKGALYRADWSEKPNAKVYKSLVLDQWRTRLVGATGTDGRYAARGFHGDCVVTVEAGGRSVEKAFSLRAGESATTVELKLP